MTVPKAPIQRKIKRLRSGEPPRVLDLFAGCGGISLGCYLAGANIIGAVELDPVAAKTHAQNFHAHEPEPRRAALAQARNISQTPPANLLKELVPSVKPRSAVDVLVGGPPCQAFARAGRAKLRKNPANT